MKILNLPRLNYIRIVQHRWDIKSRRFSGHLRRLVVKDIIHGSAPMPHFYKSQQNLPPTMAPMKGALNLTTASREWVA